MSDSLRDMLSRMDDQELLENLVTARQDYTEEVQHMMRDLLTSRGYTDRDIEEYRSKSQKYDETQSCEEEGLKATLPSHFTESEVQKWAMLRAIEWGKWPLFVTQPIIPVLLLVVKWWILVLCVVIANLLWGTVRYRFVSAQLAHWGCLFVRLKWISSIAMGVYFYFNGSILYAVLALFWPFVTLILSAVQLTPILYGQIERSLLERLGVLPSVSDYNEP